MQRHPHRRLRALVAAAASLSLTVVLAACGGAKIGASSGGSKSSCGNVKLAVNPWVGYEADAAVVSYVAKTELGCTVTEKNLSEEVSWQGFSTGQVDAVLENWGHDDLKQKYITDQKVAVEAGQTGNTGVIGWFVPPWLAEKYPDILSSDNLNKYADLLKTSESGGKGQLLDGDPSYVTNDAALVKNLGLDYQVVYAGSEAALITSFRAAQKNKTPLLGYFYSPQWFLSEVDLKQVALPKYTEGCDADAAAVACGYPTYQLDKIVSKKFAASGSPAYSLVKKFHWTNEDQDLVAKYIAQDKMTPQAAAAKWVKANPSKVKAWTS